MVHAIILLAGKGTRLSKETPKQFIQLANKPLFVFPCETFNGSKEIDTITLVVPKGQSEKIKDIAKNYALNKVNNIVEGGETRQESVRNALISLKKLNVKDEDIVLIHDSARIFVSGDTIRDNIKACREHHAVVTAINAVDSMILGDKNITEYLDRRVVHHIQTPQTFDFKLIYDAHMNNINNRVTDDASLLYQQHSVYIVPGSTLNFKVTTAEDLWFAKVLLGIN